MKKIKMLLSNSINNDIRVKKEYDMLQKMGYNIEVICWNRNHEKLNEKQYQVTNINIFSNVGSGKKQFVSYIKFLLQAKKYLEKNSDFDLLYCHDIDTILFLLFYKISNKKVIVDLHEMIDKERYGKIANKILLFVCKKIFKKVTGVILVNKYQFYKYQDILPHKLEYIYNYPSKRYFNNIKLDTNVRNIININFSGAVRTAYKLDELILAVKDIKNINVYINGEGTDLERLRLICRTYEIKNVVFTGKFSCENIGVLYKNMDITYCILNKNTVNARVSFPTKAYESLMLGIPLIVDADTQIAEFVKKYKVGFVIKEDFTLMDCLHTISSDFKTLQEYKINIKNLIDQCIFKFWWEDQHVKYKEFIEWIIE